MPARSVEVRQSWAGTLSLTVALVGLFLLAVQGILSLQVSMGMSGAMRLLIDWIARGELLTGLIGTCFALLSFPFSSRRQRNATLGLLISLAILGAWLYLANWEHAAG